MDKGEYITSLILKEAKMITNVMTIYDENIKNRFVDANREDFFTMDFSLYAEGFYQEENLIHAKVEEEKDYIVGAHIREAKDVIKKLLNKNKQQ